MDVTCYSNGLHDQCHLCYFIAGTISGVYKSLFTLFCTSSRSYSIYIANNSNFKPLLGWNAASNYIVIM
jgi:hypothetical protein